MSALEEEKKYANSQSDVDGKFAPRLLSTTAFPKEFETKFASLPKHKPQRFGKESVFEGQKDRRKPYYNTKIDFFSRVGQLRMTFDGLQTQDGKDKVYNGTGTVFYVNDESKRAYAITAGHNLIYYDAVNKTMHALRHCWFDRRITSNGWAYTSSESKKKYPVDQEWVHPEYNPAEIIHEYDIAIVSFVCDDGYYCGSNESKSALNNAGVHLQKTISMHTFRDKAMKYAMEHNSRAAFGGVAAAFKMGAAFGVAAAADSMTPDLNVASLSIIGYPGEKRGQLWGEALTTTRIEENILSKECNQEKNGKMISYNIHTSAGQSGSSIVSSTAFAVMDSTMEAMPGRSLAPPIVICINTILGVHTSTNSEDRNYGVLITKEIAEWIKCCVLSNEQHKDAAEIVTLFRCFL